MLLGRRFPFCLDRYGCRLFSKLPLRCGNGFIGDTWHVTSMSELSHRWSTKLVQDALLHARSMYILCHWFIINDDTFVFDFRHALISSTHQPFHFISGCTWSTIASDQEHSSSFVSIVNEQQMNSTCCWRSIANESTRILLAPRVETAIAESTISDVSGLFQPEIN